MTKSWGCPRSYRDLTYHLFQISRAFLGLVSGQELICEKLGESTCDELVSFAEIANDGEVACQAVLAWWESTGQTMDFATTVTTYHGPQSLHETLERTAWQTGQHVRQIIVS